MNRPNPIAEKAMRTVLMVRIRMIRSNAASSGRGGTSVAEDFSQHVLLFELPTGRLGDPEGEDRHH